jgi:hypothetical protein
VGRALPPDPSQQVVPGVGGHGDGARGQVSVFDFSERARVLFESSQTQKKGSDTRSRHTVPVFDHRAVGNFGIISF